MRNSDDVFESLGGSFFKYLIESTNKGNNTAAIRLALVICALLAFVGVEAIKIIFRNNFGSKGLNLFRVILSSIAFGIIAGTTFAFLHDAAPEKVIDFGGPSSFMMGGGFYIFLSIYVLVKGIIEKRKPNNQLHPQYRGDSILLGFLMKGGWSQAKVQNLAEPIFTFSIGVLFLAINPIWGLPLIFCAISVWLHLVMEAVFGISKVRDVLAEKGHQISQHTQFFEASN